MKLRKLIFTISVAMAIAILALISFESTKKEALVTRPDDELETFSKTKKEQATSVKRVSRFLAQDNPRAEFHCNKDSRVCHAEGSAGSTCCSNKCVDLKTDSNNCGACQNKCKFTESCCNGECVNLYYDKRNCGRCNNKCLPGGYCIYGMCDYA